MLSYRRWITASLRADKGAYCNLTPNFIRVDSITYLACSATKILQRIFALFSQFVLRRDQRFNNSDGIISEDGRGMQLILLRFVIKINLRQWESALNTNFL